MQIREKLVSTQRRYLLLTAAGMAVWASLVLAVAGTNNAHPPTWFFAAAVPVFAVVLFGMFGMNFLIRCPKCRGNMSRVGPLAARPLFRRRRVENCPFCGVNLDTRVAP